MASKRRLQLSAAEASISEVRQRVAYFARTVYPRGAEKALQREFDISESSAERVLRGQASQPIINQMLARWGWRFAQFVLEPLCGQVDPTGVRREIEETKRQAQEALRKADDLSRTLARMDGGSADPGGRPPDPSRELAGRASREADRPLSDDIDYRLGKAFEGESRRRFGWGGR